MTVALLDTTVVIHLSRKYRPAQLWYAAQEVTYSITSISWAEVMVGVPNKRAQADARAMMSGFELIYLTQTDQAWAMEQIERLRFSHGVSLNDTLIAAVAHRLNVPLYTHNLKDMSPMIGGLAVKPYR